MLGCVGVGEGWQAGPSHSFSSLLIPSHPFSFLLISSHFFSFLLIPSHFFSFLLISSHSFSFLLIPSHFFSFLLTVKLAYLPASLPARPPACPPVRLPVFFLPAACLPAFLPAPLLGMAPTACLPACLPPCWAWPLLPACLPACLPAPLLGLTPPACLPACLPACRGSAPLLDVMPVGGAPVVLTLLRMRHRHHCFSLLLSYERGRDGRGSASSKAAVNDGRMASALASCSGRRGGGDNAKSHHVVLQLDGCMHEMSLRAVREQVRV